MMDDQANKRLGHQLRFDFFKRMTEINIACILFVSALLDGVFAQPQGMEIKAYKSALLRLYGGYGVSLFLSVIVMNRICSWLTDDNPGKLKPGVFSELLALICFIVGLEETVSLAMK